MVHKSNLKYVQLNLIMTNFILMVLRLQKNIMCVLKFQQIQTDILSMVQLGKNLNIIRGLYYVIGDYKNKKAGVV